MMHRYFESKLPWINPFTIIGVWIVLVLIFSAAMYEGALHHEVGVRNSLPNPVM